MSDRRPIAPATSPAAAARSEMSGGGQQPIRSPYDLGVRDLAELVAEAGEPAYRARQLAAWLDTRHVCDPAEMSDLPAGFRGWLGERWKGAGLTLRQHQAGDDGWTHKFLFNLPGGDAVESVLMFYPPTRDAGGIDDERGPQGRATVCISTQAGCAMGCTFCATGQYGFTRHLTTGEVVEQVARVWAAVPSLRPSPIAPDRLTNVVFMGMGEPFANPQATWGAAYRLHDGFGLSARSITISTVGLVPQIRRAAAEPLPISLAVSIHAPDDELRSQLVPVNRTWPIAEVIDAVRAYVRATRRRVSFEYALMAGVNDQPDHGDRLGRLLAGLRTPGGGHAAHVNAIPFNPTPGSDFAAPSPQAVRGFTAAVAAHGVPVSVRANRGVGIDAACGQLRTKLGRPGRRPVPLGTSIPLGPPRTVAGSDGGSGSPAVAGLGRGSGAALRSGARWEVAGVDTRDPSDDAAGGPGERSDDARDGAPDDARGDARGDARDAARDGAPDDTRGDARGDAAGVASGRARGGAPAGERGDARMDGQREARAAARDDARNGAPDGARAAAHYGARPAARSDARVDARAGLDGAGDPAAGLTTGPTTGPTGDPTADPAGDPTGGAARDSRRSGS